MPPLVFTQVPFSISYTHFYQNLSRYVSDASLACAKISEHLFPKIYPQKVKPQKLQQINEIIHVFKPERQTCCKFVIVFFCPNFDIYTMYKRRDDGNVRNTKSLLQSVTSKTSSSRGHLKVFNRVETNTMQRALNSPVVDWSVFTEVPTVIITVSMAANSVREHTCAL